MADYAILKNGICINIITADDAFATAIGGVALPQGFGIGDSCIEGRWKKRPDVVTERVPTPADRLTALEAAMLEVMSHV